MTIQMHMISNLCVLNLSYRYIHPLQTKIALDVYKDTHININVRTPAWSSHAYVQVLGISGRSMLN